MSLAWVAGSVRASLLASRRVGRAGARAVAASGSLADALRELAASPYGRELEGARSLEEAQHAVAAALLWNLRVLAGWLPAVGGERLRALAAWFEIANVQDRLAYLAGEPYRPPHDPGGLGTAWPALARAGSPEALRSALADSAWGDPGSAEPAAVAAAMRAAWAGRVIAAVPEAASWARTAAALAEARRDGSEDLWLAEAQWWSRVEAEAARLAAARRQGPSTVVGVVALLAADAWRVRAALAAAALGPDAAEAFDAVA
jgi:hypothetical protein